MQKLINNTYDPAVQDVFFDQVAILTQETIHSKNLTLIQIFEDQGIEVI